MTHEARENRALLALYDAYPQKRFAFSSHETPFITDATEPSLIAWYFLEPFLTRNPKFQDKAAKETYKGLIESRVDSRFNRVKQGGGSLHTQMGAWLSDTYECYAPEDMDIFRAAYIGMGFVLDAALMRTKGSIVAEANALGEERLEIIFSRNIANAKVSAGCLPDDDPFPDTQVGLNKLIWPLSEIIAPTQEERRALFDGATTMFYVACDIQDTPYDK